MTEIGVIKLVIGINCFMALLVVGATYGLWVGKQRLRRLREWLHAVELNPNQLRYEIALQRVQLTQQRLGVVTRVAKWQMRSRQLKQLMQLIQLLRTIVLIQSGRYRLLRGRRSNSN